MADEINWRDLLDEHIRAIFRPQTTMGPKSLLFDNLCREIDYEAKGGGGTTFENIYSEFKPGTFVLFTDGHPATPEEAREFAAKYDPEAPIVIVKDR